MGIGEMKMKRSMILSLGAVAVAAMVSSAVFADTDIAVNLRYDNPANEAEGGTFTVVAKTDNANGIGGLSANVVGVDLAGAAIATDIGHNIGTDTIALFGTTVNMVYGQDLVTITAGVGTVGGPGDLGADALGNSAWDNAAGIATGTFGASRPVIDGNPSDVGGSLTGVNELDGSGGVVDPAPSIGSLTVRGDSVGIDGLVVGDANRDWTVNSADLALLLTSFNSTTGIWDEGNFNNTAGSPNTDINSADLALLLTNFNSSGTPPAISAVPEPASILLGAMGIFAVLGFSRRSR
jgi:PEP-CTERM motif-containing protein